MNTEEKQPANYLNEVHERPDDPSCHVCGAVMVPAGWKCLSCGITTQGRDCWKWQGNEEDHLESMGNAMVVEITGAQLRVLVSEARAQANAEIEKIYNEARERQKWAYETGRREARAQGMREAAKIVRVKAFDCPAREAIAAAIERAAKAQKEVPTVPDRLTSGEAIGATSVEASAGVASELRAFVMGLLPEVKDAPESLDGCTKTRLHAYGWNQCLHAIRANLEKALEGK